DRDGIDPRLDGDRRVGEPFESRAPVGAHRDDCQLGEARRQAGAEAAEGAQRLRAVGKLRALQPYLERTLHLAARPGNDRVVDTALVGVEFCVDNFGRAGHGGSFRFPGAPYAIVTTRKSRAHGLRGICSLMLLKIGEDLQMKLFSFWRSLATYRVRI